MYPITLNLHLQQWNTAFCFLTKDSGRSAMWDSCGARKEQLPVQEIVLVLSFLSLPTYNQIFLGNKQDDGRI